MNRTTFSLLLLLTVGLSTTAGAQTPSTDSSTPRPNILWLFQEDLSPWLGCYGYDVQRGHTPTLDAMAARGVRFSRAFVPAPVCSICRSAIITGVSQIRFGAHEHRSRRGEAAVPLPPPLKTLPELMTDEGYYCFNVGKTDYNFASEGLYETVPRQQADRPWRAVPSGQPFFGQIQLKGGKLNTARFEDKTDPDTVTVPADYPQNRLYREVVAEHFDSARKDDGIIGDILQRLDEDGLTDSTIVVYFSDHGANHLVRHKQQPTEGGSHVPFIIVGPSPWVPAPSVRDDLVSMLDLTATTLAWAGIDQPEWMEGQNLFGFKLVPREFVATARDRCDQTIDRIRSIRTDRFRYTRNYLLDRVLLQPQYRDGRPPVVNLRELFASGELAPHLVRIYFGERPAEEFYDVQIDPAQVNNLVGDPEFEQQLNRHRRLMDQWLAKGDTGEGDEPEIELRMADNPKWGRGVNPEYEAIRTDDDGDGLSSAWEELNGRDPKDGQILFQFDCGGWQTEGWTAAGTKSNLAGPQGLLDFDLETGPVTLLREGLQVKRNADTCELVIRGRASQPVQLTATVNGQQLATGNLQAGDRVQAVRLPGPLTAPQIRSIALTVTGPEGTTVVIDEIRLNQMPGDD